MSFHPNRHLIPSQIVATNKTTFHFIEDSVRHFISILTDAPSQIAFIVLLRFSSIFSHFFIQQNKINSPFKTVNSSILIYFNLMKWPPPTEKRPFFHIYAPTMCGRRARFQTIAQISQLKNPISFRNFQVVLSNKIK